MALTTEIQFRPKEVKFNDRWRLSFPLSSASHTNHPLAAMEDPIASTNLATAGKPSQTIYVNNLNEKIKLPKLKQTLATTFRPLGTVLEVVALSNVPLAFATFLCRLLTTTIPIPPSSRSERGARRLLLWKLKNKPSPLSKSCRVYPCLLSPCA